MKNKRFLAIFLVLTMLVSLMPVGFAADEPEEELVVEEAEEVAEIAQDQVDKPVQNDDTMFSESLAMSYIAGKKFAQALEIIEHISADNPEKSIYFADQIRFLRKLVLNQKLLNQN